MATDDFSHSSACNKKYQDLFLHSHQRSVSESYKRLCDAIVTHVFERVSAVENFPTPDMINNSERRWGSPIRLF